MSRMKTAVQKTTYKNGKEAVYKDTGYYKGVITDEETGKKYQVVGKDQLKGKPNAFGYGPRRDVVNIWELEADGVTKKTDGLYVEGVSFHDHIYTRRDVYGDVKSTEFLTDKVTVYPDGEDKSHVCFDLGGGWSKFGGSVKGIYSLKSAESSQRMKLEKSDKFYSVYKALYNKNFEKLIKGLLDASQTIRNQAKAREATKEQDNIGNTNSGESR